jgi:hypothetical protein
MVKDKGLSRDCIWEWLKINRQHRKRYEEALKEAEGAQVSTAHLIDSIKACNDMETLLMEALRNARN